jgi:hypothetical protein
MKSSAVGPAVFEKPDWLGHSIWRTPRMDISNVNRSPLIPAMSYYRDGGEAMWRGDRPRLSLSWDPRPPMFLQVEQGATWETPLAAPGTLSFCPSGVTIRSVQSAARRLHAVWNTNLYSAVLPELGAAASHFEFRASLQDPLLGHIVSALAEDAEDGFEDRVTPRSALCRASSAADTQRTFIGTVTTGPGLHRGASRGRSFCAVHRHHFNACNASSTEWWRT